MAAVRAAAVQLTRCSTRRRSIGPSKDRFFVCIEATDPIYEVAKSACFPQRIAPNFG